MKEAKLSFAEATESEGGAGGSRTLVQTSSKSAFYMLSLLLVFEFCPGKDTRKQNLISFISPDERSHHPTSPKLCCTPLISLESGMSACGMSRPDTWCRDKALIYYTSILGSESVISFANYLCENSF